MRSEKRRTWLVAEEKVIVHDRATWTLSFPLWKFVRTNRTGRRVNEARVWWQWHTGGTGWVPLVLELIDL